MSNLTTLVQQVEGFLCKEQAVTLNRCFRAKVFFHNGIKPFKTRFLSSALEISYKLWKQTADDMGAMRTCDAGIIFHRLYVYFLLQVTERWSANSTSKFKIWFRHAPNILNFSHKIFKFMITMFVEIDNLVNILY